ncbi:MYND domain-containingprotein [Apiospora marii]|uniref:MYND domain-containingprotein n=1 Tax=Apiospora marii TaxID=335849 RepID=UPI00312D91D8
MDSESIQESDPRIDLLLEERQQLTDELVREPYDFILYLKRRVCYANLAYPDLAAGDAYSALMLTDEASDVSLEYHEQVIEALHKYSSDKLPKVFEHRLLLDMAKDVAHGPALLAHLGAVRSYQILAMGLLLCGSLQSAYKFCERGLKAAPTNSELRNIQGYIETIGKRRVRRNVTCLHDLPDWGMVRREVYPWNHHEPDRFSEDSIGFLNERLSTMAPKCAVQVATLPVLLENARNTDGYEIIPTYKKLGLFAIEDIAAGETAQELYHPAVCEKDVDSIAKDTDAKGADEALHLLLLARVLALAAHQEIHPLEVSQIKCIWGDFVPTKCNEVDLSPNAGPPPDWTLPFSFTFNIEAPLRILEKMGIDMYSTLVGHDLWVFNTLYSKTRGTTSARKNPHDGRPGVAAVHPFWCLANHDCDPNVTWECAGRMVLAAREKRVVGDRPGRIKRGEDTLNHYCDVTPPVHNRRELVSRSLAGWYMCARCRTESANAIPNGCRFSLNYTHRSPSSEVLCERCSDAGS